MITELERIFHACRRAVSGEAWQAIVAACPDNREPEAFADCISSLERDDIPEYLYDIARIEIAMHEVNKNGEQMPGVVESLTVNPALRMLRVSWRNLPALVNRGEGHVVEPLQGDEIVIVWFDPVKKKTRLKVAGQDDLLALKIVTEGISPEDAAKEGGVAVGIIDDILYRAGMRGILLTPPSLIRRSPEFPRGKNIDEEFFSSPVFTLQWHVTQVCDLHCKHCYDRSGISTLVPGAAIGILDDMRRFCLERGVTGHISFTGGNPLLYPKFLELYRAASDRGFSLAILGNPAPKQTILDIKAIQEPAFFQVSLEGLQEHNDDIRGRGHFDSVISFLSVLRESGIYSMVMLTLTKDNLDQVLPLADFLRDKTDFFTFNRLSMVGEGASLSPVGIEGFEMFLKQYIEAAKTNPVVGLKDNLINIIRRQQGQKPFGGCAGYGCGAAFDFIAVLPDGEAHACRKFPSPIGNILKEGIAGVYDSDAARRYREGCSACKGCDIRPVCGGCLAVAHSMGLDIFSEKDPYCFMP